MSDPAEDYSIEDERLSVLEDEAAGAFNAYPPRVPQIPPERLLELVPRELPVLKPNNDLSLHGVGNFVSRLAALGTLLPPDDRYRLAAALIRYSAELPADPCFDFYNGDNLCCLLLYLTAHEQALLVNEMCESNGGWHLQTLARWIAYPETGWFDQHDQRRECEAREQLVAVMQDVPALRQRLEWAAGPKVCFDLRWVAPDALRRLRQTKPAADE